MVAVQDCGLIIDMKTAESQVYGALIMGVSYALSEEKVIDPVTGQMLNVGLLPMRNGKSMVLEGDNRYHAICGTTGRRRPS